MGRDWYEALARKFGGYRKMWDSEFEGEDGEAAFTAFLRETLRQKGAEDAGLMPRRPGPTVLDVGCGDGLYTLHVSALAAQVTGLDFSPEMITLARRNQQSAAIPNVDFVGATTSGTALPFPDQSFDLIFSRRGPSSHLADARRVLKPGGLVAGIHTGARDEIIGRVEAAGFQVVRNQEYRGTEIFPTREDYALFLSRIPGNPDYTLPEHAAELDRLTAPPPPYRAERWWFIWAGTPSPR
ncbi:MAG: Methyltransferase type 11 [Symbiobacteriaceae bacterium]|jgi:SAM-dependent methyltransferase|nr:Methyltransferase type 11 [Symbiobacteriaceae bacterium]